MRNEEEVFRCWKTLVIKVGAKRPRSNNSEFVFREWCPEGTLNANHLKECRPKLRMVLEQSLKGTLNGDDFPSRIVKKKEFRKLFKIVHGNFDPVSEEDFLKWSRKNINKINMNFWNQIEKSTKSSLMTCFIRFQVFEVSMNELSREMKIWRADYTKVLAELAELISANQDITNTIHIEKIQLGYQRIITAESIIDKIDEFITYYSDLLRKEIINSIVDGHQIKEIPEWAESIDRASVDGGIEAISMALGMRIDTKLSEDEQKLERIDNIFNDPDFSNLLSELYEIID